MLAIMEDVTASIFSALFLASFVFDHFAARRRQTKAASALLLIAAALTLWTRIYLPISNAAGNTLAFMVMAAWLGFIALVAPKWLREAKAAARE
jgi:hypothetical protein